MKPSGTFTWNITDKSFIHNILNAKNGQTFYSQKFNIAKLHWQLELYPNGRKKEQKGSFHLYLKLIKMPRLWAQIYITRI